MTLALWIAAALAGDPLSFDAVTTVTHGQEVPRVRFDAHVSGFLRASVTCGEREWNVSRNVSDRSHVELPLDGIAEGEHACELTVLFREADGGSEGESVMPFTVRSLGLVGLKADLSDIDLDAGSLVVHATRPVAKGAMTALGAKGVVVATADADLSDPANPRFSWRSGGQTVVKIEVQTDDGMGFTSTLTLRPWSYDIPHEDVVFATGSAEVPASEVPKLETAWAQVVHAIDLYGEVVDIKLFVAGYTDTVGDAASNLALSRRRAQSIARWFLDRGFPGPVSYQGFGETVLAVPTPDNTDEPANRRAIYLLSSEVPRSPEVPRGDWSSLR